MHTSSSVGVTAIQHFLNCQGNPSCTALYPQKQRNRSSIQTWPRPQGFRWDCQDAGFHCDWGRAREEGQQVKSQTCGMVSSMCHISCPSGFWFSVLGWGPGPGACRLYHGALSCAPTFPFRVTIVHDQSVAVGVSSPESCLEWARPASVVERGISLASGWLPALPWAAGCAHLLCVLATVIS